MSDLFGDLGGIVTALGIDKQADGDRPGWFSAPEAYLKTMLSDPEQRAALIEVIDGLLGGEDATTEDGRTLLPLAEIDPVRVFATLTERDGLIDIGLLVRVRAQATTTDTGGELDLEVPLVAASGEETSEQPLLLGTAHGAIRLRVALLLPSGAPAGPGGLALAGAELTALIPTDGALPSMGLALRGLRMPGATEAVDLEVDPATLADLGGSLLQFVLGLVSAQLDGLGAGDPVRALAGLFGLIGADGVPDFPIAELVQQGPGALARWWALALADGSRDAWLGHLATLLGGTIGSAAGIPVVEVTIAGDLRLRVGVRTAPGAAGLPVVTPVIGIVTDAAPGVELACEVEPVSLDLATGAAVPLPGLKISATVGGTSGPLLPTQDVGGLPLGVGSIAAGFSLTAARTPQFVLEARDAVVGTTTYSVLDLTSGDALAAAGGGVLGDAAEVLLNNLGEVGDVLAHLVGLDGGSAPQIDPVRLLSDPIGAIRERWLALLGEAPAVIRGVLTELRNAFASAAGQALPVEGTGTPDDPYRIVLVPGLALELVREGTRVAVALAGRATHDLPAATGARVAVDARVSLLRADLDAQHPSASVAGDLAAAVSVTPTADAPLALGDDTVRVRTRGLGARVRWRPGADAAVTPWLREPQVEIAGHTVDLDALRQAGVLAGGTTPLAEVAAQAVADQVMDAAHALAEQAVDAARAWASDAADALAEAVEQLAAAGLAAVEAEAAALGAAHADALRTLRELLAWGSAATGGERLSLAALAADPAAELRRWTQAVCGIDPATGAIDDADRLLAAVARIARLAGIDLPDTTGLLDDPLRFVLPGIELLAGLAGDDVQRVVSRVTGALEGWTPGDPLPDPADLLTALAAEAGVDGVLADVLAGRALGADAIEGLVARWAYTDGLVGVAVSGLPAGLDLTRIDGLLSTATLHGDAVRAAVTSVLGGAPARLVLVGVDVDGEPELLPARGQPGIVLDIDLTAAGVPAVSFALPGAALAGVTVVRLAGKGASVPDGQPASAATGFDAQVARLRPVLADLASASGPVVVVAGGAAGRVAVAAAEGTGVATVVTVGTPWTPLALGDIDAGPAAEGVRLLASLIGLEGDDDPVDAAVQRGRDLVRSLLVRDARGDPLTELAAPDLPLPAGLDVRAIIGRIDEAAVREAITALVRRALDVRATARAAVAAAEAAATDALSRLGVRVPVEWGDEPGGLRARLETDLDLAGALSDLVDGGSAAGACRSTRPPSTRSRMSTSPPRVRSSCTRVRPGCSPCCWHPDRRSTSPAASCRRGACSCSAAGSSRRSTNSCPRCGWARC